MKARNFLIGVATVFATGFALGIMVAPRKGSKTRKMMLDMKEEWLDTLKSSFNQAVDAITRAKDETTDAAHKVVNKTSTLASQARHAN